MLTTLACFARPSSILIAMTGCSRAASLTLAAQAAVNSNFSEAFFFIVAVTFCSGIYDV